jgi:UDP-glucose 4-epimerase
MKKHYLITGGAGFIGSHLVETLLDSGHTVTVVDDLSTGCQENIEHLLGRSELTFVHDTVESWDGLGAAIAAADTVVHLAATVGVELVVQDPVRTIETNVHATERLCKLMAENGGGRMLLASTSEVYGRSAAVRFRETDDLLIGPPTHHRWTYAASKALDEYLLMAYYKEKKMQPTICRLFNTVGPRQTGRYGMVLPRFVEAALAGKSLSVYGDGTQVRCFCHVRDVVRALVGLLAEESAVGGIFNIGSESPISIAALAETVTHLLDSESTIETIPYDQAYEPGFEDMMRRVPDTTRIRELIGWNAEISLEQTIVEVADSLRQG